MHAYLSIADDKFQCRAAGKWSLGFKAKRFIQIGMLGTGT